MRIIISPAKKMNQNTDIFRYENIPAFLEETEKIMRWVQELSFEKAQELWRCNDKIAGLNFERFRQMDLRKDLTPALLAYEGIQYQHMAPQVFSEREWSYVQRHLRILSGFYGVLRPLDGVVPYRLEMQARAGVQGKKDLYEFWGDKLYRGIQDKSEMIINLASKEYSRCIEQYLKAEDVYITCVFGELKNGKVIQKGTQAKMARGEMVRFLAEHNIKDPVKMQSFARLDYRFAADLSGEREYIFLKG